MYGFGAPNLLPADLQQIIGAKYVNTSVSPILSGLVVTGNSDMTYSYTAGVAVIGLANGAALEVAIKAGKTGATTAPASGSRIDYIYVDSNSQVQVGASYNASMGALIDARVVTAGTTATSQTTSQYDRNYAEPYGASQGVMLHIPEVAKAGDVIAAAETDRYNGNPYFQTDRDVMIVLRGNIRSVVTPPGNSNYTGSLNWALKVDGTQIGSVEIRYDRFNAQFTHIWFLAGANYLKAGHRAIKVTSQQQWVGDTQGAMYFAGNPWSPGGLSVIDLGVHQ